MWGCSEFSFLDLCERNVESRHPIIEDIIRGLGSDPQSESLSVTNLTTHVVTPSHLLLLCSAMMDVARAQGPAENVPSAVMM
eukprot:COSAG02_NODE_13507_length_1385_cov_1.279160_2_plen_82_part_00